MATTQGTAIVWGVSSTNMTGFSAAVSGGYTFTGEDWAQERDKVELKDKSGEIKTVYYYNNRVTVSLKCYPSGTSADATSTPTIGEKVVVYSSDGDIGGTYLCDSVSKARSQDGVVEFDISLIAYAGVSPT